MIVRSVLISALAGAIFVASAAFSQTTQPFLGTEESIPATPTAHPRRPATIEAVRLGWRSNLLADCWGPARVYISGNPNIAGGAFGGVLEVLYAQDGSQSAQITVPIATTPGRITPVELALALPLNVSQLTLTLYDQFGRIVDSRKYQRGDNSLPATLLDATPLVLAVADRTGVAPSVAKAFAEPGLRAVGAANTIAIGRPSPSRNPMDDLACVTVTADDLPETWAAYEGVAAVVIGTDEIAALPAAKLAALLDWLRSGGCVIARVGAAGAGVSRLLADAPGRVEVREAQQLTPGPELERLFAEPTQVEKDAKLIQIQARGRDSVQGRPIALGDAQDPDAKAWRVRWALRDATRVNGVETEGLLAEGPIGFGWVVLLGIDPPQLASGSDDAPSRIAWREALRNTCAELATRARSSDQYSWGTRGSGSDHSARIATRSVLNALSDAPALGDSAFIVIVLCLLALAGAIGPIDGLVLGRFQKRQLSWATALAWIAVASILAAALPPLLRGGESKLRRLRVVDAIGGARPQTIAWQTGVTTLFAGVGGPVRLTPADPATHDTSWFRGISPLFVQPFNSSDPLVRFATLQQEPPGNAPVAGRSNRIDPNWAMRMGQWTFRTFAEQGPTGAPPGVRVDRILANASDSWTVQLPASMGSFVNGSLRIGDSWDTLELADGVSDGVVTLRARGGNKEWDVRAALTRTGAYGDLEFQSGVALELPGARERSRSLDARLASGEWAAVYLRMTAPAPTLRCERLSWTGSGDAYDGREDTIYRLLVPLSDARVPRTPWSVALPKTVAPEAGKSDADQGADKEPDNEDNNKDADNEGDQGEDTSDTQNAPGMNPPQPPKEPAP